LGHRPWDLFLTLTSNHVTHPEALHKRFRYCCHKISDDLYGRHWQRRGQGVEYVVGMERHKSGLPHSHAVLRLADVDLSDASQFSLAHWQKWITETGGFCRLERPRSQADVVSYASKYVLKEGDLTLSDNLDPYEAGSQMALFRAATAAARKRKLPP
jgi:hypothetical protein